MKMKKRFLSILLSLVMVLGLLPGMSLTAFAETVTGISLNKTTLSTILDTNSSGNILTATVTPSNAANKTVVWTCSDSTVVKASPNSNLGDGGYQNLCYLRTLKAGTATITVTATNGTDDTSDDQSATCTVTVYDPYPIGTVWKLGDTINLHGAWYRDPLGTAVYVYHSKDAEGKVPTDLQLIGSSVAEWRNVIPVSEYLDESKTDGYPIIPYTEDRKGSLRLSIPEDKKGETPLGIKLASGKGTASNPYVFELAYKAAPTVTAPTAKNLTYTGSAQALVTAGEATGGKMYYTLGENATTAPADNLYTTSIPTKTDAGTYYVWYYVKGDGNHNDTVPDYVTSVIRGEISATVTFKVANGSWNDGEGEEATADRTVTLTGYEGDKLMLTADQIPAVGEKPADGYKAGAWDVTPSTEIEITQDTTYTYTYAEKAGISATVTFKVVNGSWNDGEGEAATADRTVTLTGKAGDVLKLSADQIPAVGKNPAAGYKAGSWDTTPGTDIEIKKDTTFTYTYAAQDAYTVTVTNDGHGTGTATPSSGTTGTDVKLTSAPETGYSFKEWQVVSGGVTITNNSFKIGNANVEIKAIFTKDPVNYNIVSVTGGEHIISGGKNAVITVKGVPDDSRTYSSFTGAAMDGREIPAGNYIAEEGSLILTLKASYLDTLSVGKHKLTISFTDGSADTTITVLAKPVPKTGDNSNPALWLALMILGLAVLAGTAVKVYRERQ